MGVRLGDDGVIVAHIPVRITSTPNERLHWTVKARRVKAQRSASFMALRAAYRAPPDWPRMKVTLTRIAPRAMDSDNLAAGFKGVRDGVADFLKIDDGSGRVTWEYGQMKGAPKEYAARIEIVDWSAAT